MGEGPGELVLTRGGSGFVGRREQKEKFVGRREQKGKINFFVRRRLRPLPNVEGNVGQMELCRRMEVGALQRIFVPPINFYHISPVSMTLIYIAAAPK